MKKINIALHIVLILLFFSCQDNKDNPAGQDQSLNELRGTWNGSEADTVAWTMSFTNTDFSLQNAAGTEWYKGRYTYNNVTIPDQINLYIDSASIYNFKGKVRLGIYKIEYTTLTIVLNMPGDSARPKVFESNVGRKIILSSNISSTPLLVDPADSLNITALSVKFSWNRCPWAVKYKLQVSTEKEFLNPMNVDTLIVDSSIAITRLPYGCNYFWRVCSHNSKGDSKWSVIRVFSRNL